MSKQKPLKVIAGEPDKPLKIDEIEIPCFVLEDETRVLVQRGMATGLGMSKPSGVRIRVFASSKSIKPFVSNEIIEVLDNPIKFLTPAGIGHGYPATLLVDICKSVLEARDAGKLRPNQLHIAERADMLLRGLAKVGIIALVDEITGYQEIREKRALATILEKYIDKEFHKWTKTFPYEFYDQIFRLKGWSGPDGMKKPSVIDHYTNDIVYSRIAPGVLEELKRRNPVQNSTGRRKRTHHQWFTQDFGHPKLKEHLIGIMALMRAAPNWTIFHRSLTRSFPKPEEPIELPLDD